MSTFSCPVVQVESVENHPDADRLSIVKLVGLGFTCISGKLEDGSPRYKVGDWVVYIPSAAVLPEWILKEMDFWNEETGKGTLAGPNGDRVKPLKLRGIFSEGILYPAKIAGTLLDGCAVGTIETQCSIDSRLHDLSEVKLGDNVADMLGIMKYEPPIPAHMSGEVVNMIDHAVRYDFDRLENVPNLFDVDEPVVAHEKIHGTFTAILFVPGLNHPEMFGSEGEIIVHSKGLGAQGLAFKNNEANKRNLYVRTLSKLLDDGLEASLRQISMRFGDKNVALLGETFGMGVQDLQYGTKEPDFRVFDIRVGDDRYLTQDHVMMLAGEFGFKLVPLVYQGPYDMRILTTHSVGNTIVNNANNIREGIVIRSVGESRHPTLGRKIAKLVSPDYLTRKSKNATEFN